MPGISSFDPKGVTCQLWVLPSPSQGMVDNAYALGPYVVNHPFAMPQPLRSAAGLQLGRRRVRAVCARARTQPRGRRGGGPDPHPMPAPPARAPGGGRGHALLCAHHQRRGAGPSLWVIMSVTTSTTTRWANHMTMLEMLTLIDIEGSHKARKGQTLRRIARQTQTRCPACIRGRPILLRCTKL